MKKMLKKMLIGALIMTMLTSLVGCNYTKKKQERIDKRKCELTLKLLEEKYGEKFELDRYYYDGGFNAICHPVEHPEIFFDVYVPHEEISSDSYAKEILVRTLQKECNKVLDELGIEYYCKPSIFVGYKESGKLTNKQGKEYIDACYSVDLNEDIKESKGMIYIFIKDDVKYDPVELYEKMKSLVNLMVVTDGAIAYVFVSDEEMNDIENYYEKSVLNKSGLIVSTTFIVGTGITQESTIDKEYSAFEQRFKEYQSKAQEANK